MTAATINQAYIFLIFIMNGFLIGLLFDFFRVLRKCFKTSDFMTYLEDIFFWILAGILLLYSVFIFNNGILRIYVFIAILIGIITYMLLFSRFVIAFSVKIIAMIKTIIARAIKLISYPFVVCYKMIRKVFLQPISFLFINVRKFASKKVFFCSKRIKNTAFFKKKEGNQT